MTPDDSTVEREEGESKGRYRLELDGAEAELTYSRAGTGLIIIDHTAVPDAMRGKSVGKLLVGRAVADARAEGRAIIALCPFARATIERMPAWQDVLKK